MTPPPYGWPAAAREDAASELPATPHGDPVAPCPLRAAEEAVAAPPEPEPAAEPDAPAEPDRASVAAITGVRVLRVAFVGHHAGLRGEVDRFVLAGEPFAAPHWDRATAAHEPSTIAERVGADAARPVAYTRGEPLRLEATFLVEGTEGSEGQVRECEFIGRAGRARKYLEFVARAEATIGQEVTVAFTASEPLPNVVQILDHSITWQAVVHRTRFYRQKKTLPAGASGPHPIYVTMGPPQEEPADFVRLRPDLPADGDGWEFDVAASQEENNELGATWRRMDAAVRYFVWARDRYVARFNRPRRPAWQTAIRPQAGLTPSQAVMMLMAQWSHYVLGERPDLGDLHAADHPRYLKEPGPWPMLDAVRHGRINAAECQAMVRGTLAVLAQVGCPGLLEKLMVFAHPATAEALEGTHPCKGLTQFAEKFGHATTFVRHRTDAQARAAKQQEVEARLEELQAVAQATPATDAESRQLLLDLQLNVYADNDGDRAALRRQGAHPWNLDGVRSIDTVSLKPHLLDDQLEEGEFLVPGTALIYAVDGDAVVPRLTPERNQRRAGANAFEACLKYTPPDGGPARYYPAGVGQSDTIEEVVGCFNRLVHVSTVRLTDRMTATLLGRRVDALAVPDGLRGKEVWYCERVVHRWR